MNNGLLRFRSTVKAYPIPIFAIAGLVAGGVLYFLPVLRDQANWVWYAILIVGGTPLVWNTARGLVKGRFASDIVAMLAIIAAIMMDQAFAGVIVVLMQSGGEAVENYGFRRAASSLDALLARAPRVARRKRAEGGGLEEVDVLSVNVSDILVVRQGDLVPVDGFVSSGSAQVDESALTGEPLPRVKSAGDQVLSGSVSVEGSFEMRAGKVSTESQYSKIVELVKKAREEKPPIQRLADRYAVWFTPVTLLVSFFGFLFTHSPTTILSVLVVATPCPLILATPIAIISGINRAAEEGIIVKGGAAIEQVSRAQAVAFDKTGTITYGVPIVEKVIPLNGRTSDELLFKAASVAQFSSHVVSRALSQKAQEDFVKLDLPRNFKETPGMGVEGTVDGERVAVGSQKYITKAAKTGNLLLTFAESPEIPEYIDSKGKMIAFVSLDGQPSGIIVFSDQIRPGISAMIQRLRDLGVKHTVLLTGDNARNALTVAKLAGIPEAQADLLPDQKVEFLKKLGQKYKTTVMVGDGINDAPALASATVGVAMGAHGTGISAEAADIVLLVDDVTKVADAVSIGQRMLRIAKQSIYAGLGLSFVFMIFASLGFVQPAIGAMLQEAIDAAVVLNALRAR